MRKELCQVQSFLVSEAREIHVIPSVNRLQIMRRDVNLSGSVCNVFTKEL